MNLSDNKEEISLLGIVIWSIAALFFLYEFFLRTFLGSMAKQVMQSLLLSPSQFALLASFFYAAYGLMQIPVGILIDYFGIKKSLLLATFICSLSSVCFALTHSFTCALISRFFMGIGGGFAFLILLMVTISWFPKSRLAFFVGLGQFIGTMGALLAGGPLASLITSISISWRIVFLWISCFGLLLLLLALIFVRPKKKTSSDTLVFIEKPLSMLQKLNLIFTSKQSYYVALYSAFVFLSVAMLGAVWGTLYLQTLGFSQQLAASIISLGWLGFGLGCPLLGYLSDLIVRRKPILIGCSFVGLILICLLVYVDLKSFYLYAILFFLLGVTSSGQSIGFAMITEHVRPEAKSIALGLNSALITLLAAVVPIIVGSLIQSSTPHRSAVHLYTSDTFTLAFSIMPLLYSLALLIAIFLIKETFCRGRKEVIYIQL